MDLEFAAGAALQPVEGRIEQGKASIGSGRKKREYLMLNQVSVYLQ
jgi:hypothetical protein